MQVDNYIENHVVRFIQVLRHLGVRVSSAEAVEALKALKYVDLLERQQVRYALRTVLAKDKESRRIFDGTFDAYFAPPEKKRERLEQRKQQVEEYQAGLKQAEEELVFAFTDDDELLEETSQDIIKKLNLTDEQKATYMKMLPKDKRKLRDYLNKHTEGNDQNNPHSLLESVVRGQLEYWRRKLAEQEEQGKNSHGTLDANFTGDEEFDEIMEQSMANLDSEEIILHEDMKNIQEKDLPHINKLIRKLSRRLAVGLSRRYRQSRKQAQVDVRKSLRHNFGFGGVLLELKYKSKRVDKPNIILLCDVSGSMARYAAFVIQFIYGLSNALEQIESFVFAEALERVTSYFKNSKDFSDTMVKVMNESSQWGKGTNLSIALQSLNTDYRKLLKANTVVIIVSDGKTISSLKAIDGLNKLGDRVKDILWLNTLPKQEWSSVKQLRDFQKYTRMFECYTLAHLEKILSRQLKVS